MPWFLVEQNNQKIVIAQSDNKEYLLAQDTADTVILSEDEFMANFPIPVDTVAAEEQPDSEGVNTI